MPSRNPNVRKNLIPFRKGDPRINRKGRPLKVYSLIKKSGYTKDDMKAAFEEVAWMNEKQLNEIIANDKAPIILKIVSRAALRAKAEGNYAAIQDIIEYTIGKAVQQIESKVEEITTVKVGYGKGEE